jgi:hypothetical protein
MTYKVFISYTHKDAGLARRVAREVEKSGGRAYFDPISFNQAAKLTAEARDALGEANAMVAIVNRNSARSPRLNYEVGAAFGLDKKVAVIIADDLQPKELPPPLRSFEVVDARQIERLVEELSRDAKPETVAR